MSNTMEDGDALKRQDAAIRIVAVGDHQTIRYAAEELARCLGPMTGREAGADPGTNPESGALSLGLMSDLPGMRAPELLDPKLDDAIHIDVQGDHGIIAGINPRSVLLATYRYLTELGCRWVRPGVDGEYLPPVEALPPVRITETPSCRHRGVCIEGAVSAEHVTDMIDWLPKLGFNAYFIQFREAHTFFNRWYSHEANPRLEGRHIGVEEARLYTEQAVKEIKKRDLLYHAVGHGWTCEPFGISGLGWEEVNPEIPAETRQYFAQIDGERKLWHGVPLNTNLCYGNPEVRRKVTEEIAAYCQEHREIDIVHFWLADGSNNNCECELCRDTRPSDFYVRMLNELDGRMSEKGLSTRVVFLAYVDLLWPPLEERVEHPDRFILMFAPITRTYSRSFSVGAPLPELPPYERNKLVFPQEVEENVAFLQAWQKRFQGDSFDFDYHLMWDHYRDPGYMQVADIIGRDLFGLGGIGLNGLVSCQAQRVFLPTGLPMTVMGRTLWRREAAPDEIAADYFDAAYGPDGPLCRGYLEKLTELFDPPYLRGEKPKVSGESAERFAAIPGVIDDFGPVIERNLGLDGCRGKSWFYLGHHARICTLLSRALEARARGDERRATEAWGQVLDYVREHEMLLHPVLDVFEMSISLGQVFGS